MHQRSRGYRNDGILGQEPYHLLLHPRLLLAIVVENVERAVAVVEGDLAGIVLACVVGSGDGGGGGGDGGDEGGGGCGGGCGYIMRG